MGRLFDQIKSASETLTEKSGQMIQSASELTKSFAETVSDKETYKNMGKTIQTKLTADKDEDGMAYYRYLICDQSDMMISKGDPEAFGASGRCVRDAVSE